jgi:hypothetical protein
VHEFQLNIMHVSQPVQCRLEEGSPSRTFEWIEVSAADRGSAGVLSCGEADSRASWVGLGSNVDGA